MYCNTANILSCHSSFIILLHKMWHPISRFIPLWKQKKIVYWMQNRIPVLYVDYSNFPLSLILHSLASLAFLFQVIVLMNSWNLFEWSCLHNPAHRRLELVMQFRSFVLLGVILADNFLLLFQLTDDEFVFMKYVKYWMWRIFKTSIVCQLWYTEVQTRVVHSTAHFCLFTP